MYIFGLSEAATKTTRFPPPMENVDNVTREGRREGRQFTYLTITGFSSRNVAARKKVYTNQKKNILNS